MKKNNESKKKIALICSMGGHFEQLTNLSELYNEYERFWITNKNKQTESYLKNETAYYIYQAHFKKPWTYLTQFPFFIKVLLKERPTTIISSGGGITCLIPFLLSYLFGIKFIYIDTFSRVHGFTKFGKFVNSLNHLVCTQWENNVKKNVLYIGPVFKDESVYITDIRDELVFVTLGTRKESFIRLIDYINTLYNQKVITEKVVIQAGFSKYHYPHFEIFDFCSPDEIDKYIMKAKYVITQESAGIGTKCLKYNTRFIVCPRDYKYKELPTASDMEEDLHNHLAELGFTKVVNSEEELKNAINSIDEIKTGFKFDNRLAINELKKLIEAN